MLKLSHYRCFFSLDFVYKTFTVEALPLLKQIPAWDFPSDSSV